jgi:hypothetical protein
MGEEVYYSIPRTKWPFRSKKLLHQCSKMVAKYKMSVSRRAQSVNM